MSAFGGKADIPVRLPDVRREVLVENRKSTANGGCMRIFAFCFSSIVACPLTINIPQAGAGSVYDGMIAAQAEANGVPVSLIHRVIMRESRYNPRAVSGGNYGLMQIRLGTARAMGYRGSAEGLLDPATNLTYAVRYLAGAYRAARGNESRAAALYARGYYGEAKRQGFSPYGSSQ
jgi:soluble lytic murein transglycosylase-like protein